MNKAENKHGFNLFSEIEAIPDILKQTPLPSLDGLRAISILLVVLFHVLMSFKTRFSFFNFANLGVQCFFVISGFLITTLLIKERILKGRISLKYFYIRRFFRIIPVAYLYLSLVVLLDIMLHLHMQGIFLITSFLFIRNFFQTARGVDHLSTHYWSLSVEEQFYFLFPVILKRNYRAYICFILGIIVLSLLIDCLSYILNLNFGGNNYMKLAVQAITQFQGIVVGSLASIILFKSNISFSKGYKIAVNIGLSLAVVLLALYDGAFPNLRNILKCICFAIILLINLNPSDDLSFRILNSGPMKLLGILSYSIYIWQQPLTQGLSTMNRGGILSQYGNKVPIDILTTIASLLVLGVISCVSYFCFERKFQKYRQRFRCNEGI